MMENASNNASGLTAGPSSAVRATGLANSDVEEIYADLYLSMQEMRPSI